MNIRSLMFLSSVLLSAPAFALHYKDGTEVPRKGDGYELVSEYSYVSPGATGEVYLVNQSSRKLTKQDYENFSLAKNSALAIDNNENCKVGYGYGPYYMPNQSPNDVITCIVAEVHSKPGQNVVLNSNHTVFMSNWTDRAMQVCIEVDMTTIQGDRIFNSFNYTLEANSLQTRQLIQNLTVNYKWPGQYVNTAITTVKIKDQNTVTVDAVVDANGIALVTS